MTTSEQDWNDCVAAFHQRFEKRLAPTREGRNWPGVNFMTPDWLGYVTTPAGEIVEVSTGWFLDHRLFGITWPRLLDGRPDPRDTSTTNLDGVAAAIGLAT